MIASMALPRRFSDRAARVAIASVLLAFAAALVGLVSPHAPFDGASPSEASMPSVNLGASVPLPEPLELKPLSLSDAQRENAAISFATGPIEAARSFAMLAHANGEADFAAALDCLTAAIYFEAAMEDERGQRAVAQVVLNRVRHPAFPASICGVVYQGSQRKNGCQFTFTCDGRLAERPSSFGWARARRIANEALRGRVERSVGMATHYHANYVVPYWASSLAKIAVEGTHIFYRWNGAWGKRVAFIQPYGGEDPASTFPGAKRAQGGDAALSDDALFDANPEEDDPLAHIPSSSLAEALQKRGSLKADETREILAVDKLNLVLDPLSRQDLRSAAN